MASFEVADGRRCNIGGRTYEAGQTVTVDDADQVKGLVNRGILVKQGQPSRQEPSEDAGRADPGQAEGDTARRRERTPRS